MWSVRFTPCRSQVRGSGKGAQIPRVGPRNAATSVGPVLMTIRKKLGNDNGRRSRNWSVNLVDVFLYWSNATNDGRR